MPVIHKEGKDTIIFATKEDHATPSKIELPEPEPRPGLILPNGEINWNCPCLGGMATGPCGVEFREAFTCFHYSTAEPKGSECYEHFKVMQTCMSQYPALYGNKDADMDDIDDEDMNSMSRDDRKTSVESGDKRKESTINGDSDKKNEEKPSSSNTKQVEQSKAK